MQGHNRAGLSWDGPMIDNAAEEMQKWMEMRLTFACHCSSQNIFCQLFAKILHPHLCVGEDGEGMEQGFSVAGQDLLFASIILLSDLFLNTLLLLQYASACLKLHFVPRSCAEKVVTWEFSQNNIFAQPPTTEWWKKIKSFHFKAHIVKNRLFWTFGFYRRKPSLKTSNQRKFCWEISTYRNHHSDLTSHFTHIIRISHYTSLTVLTFTSLITHTRHLTTSLRSRISYCPHQSHLTLHLSLFLPGAVFDDTGGLFSW